MYVSYNWLKEFVDIDMTTGGLEHILTMLGHEVEEIIDYSDKFNNFYTGEVISCEKHPDADKLTVCSVDYGKGEKQIICGAPNVDSGQKVIVAAPGAEIPSAGFTIGRRKIRGIESEGMICSEAELGIGEDSGGITVLPESTEIGTPVAKYLQLNDTVFDVTITPNRADCLSHLGLARDLAAYYKKEISLPKICLNEQGGPARDSIEVIIEDPEKCPRYTARVIRGIRVQESPDWLKNRLILLGLRPVNVVVDVTNFVLHECGQPLHAFDLNRISGNKIIIKTARKGEKFITLDDKERTLDEHMLMICDAEKNIAIGGVMGGANSEIGDKTTDVLLESAYFDPSSVRRTAKKLAIQSDSSYRFERGVDVNRVDKASDRAAQMIAELAGGTIEKGIVDIYPDKIRPAELPFRYDRARDIIGEDIPSEDMKGMLLRLGFEIKDESEHKLTVLAPTHRHDMEQEIDLVEEIARLYTYEEIEAKYETSISFGAMAMPDYLRMPTLTDQLRAYMVNNGFFEIITQNMIDPASAKIFTDAPVRIANPLGEELSIMRPSVVPSALRVIEKNFRLNNYNLRLFEIGRIFEKCDPREDTFIEGIREKQHFMAAMTGEGGPVQWAAGDREVDFYDIKGLAEDMIEFLMLTGIKIKPAKSNHPAFSKNSVELLLKKKSIGRLGEIRRDLLEKFDIENNVYMLLIDFDEMARVPVKEKKYSPVSPYPGISRDLAFVAPDKTPAGEVEDQIWQNGGKLLNNVRLFDVYSGKSIGSGMKSLAFNLYYSSPERTLVDKEVDKSVNKIVKAIEKKFDAKLREF